MIFDKEEKCEIRLLEIRGVLKNGGGRKTRI
jgi:hypothetical protein